MGAFLSWPNITIDAIHFLASPTWMYPGTMQTKKNKVSHKSKEEDDELTNTNDGDDKISAAIAVKDPNRRCVNVFNDLLYTVIIYNNADAGWASFLAKNFIAADILGQNKKHDTAVAIWERGTTKQTKVVKFLYAVLAAVLGAIETRVAVPRTLARDEHLIVLPGGERRSIDQNRTNGQASRVVKGSDMPGQVFSPSI